MRMRLFTVTALLSLGFLSCGSSNSSSSSTSIPRSEACAQASEAACAKVFSCPTTDPVVATVQFVLGGSKNACQASIQAMYCSTFECATAADYHGEQAGQCKQQFSDASCQDLSAAGLSAATAGVPAFLAAFPQCGQICGRADAGSGG